MWRKSTIEAKTTSSENKSEAKKAPANKNVEGFYDFKIGDERFQSSDLEDNYCNMTFNYAADKSFVVIRWKSKKSSNAFLLTIYGSEVDIDNPGSSLVNIMSSTKERPAIIASFVKGETMEMLNLGEGELNLEEFSKGKIVGSIKGKGGTQMNILKKEPLVNYEGSFSLTTKLVTITGK
jgi:hypothetical protein